jgi:acetoin utilization protein AcuB
LYLLSELKVKKIMTKDVIAVPSDFTVEETADLLLRHKISGVPVLDKEDQVVGVITQDDIFRVLISLAGMVKFGVQFACRIEDRPGSIKELSDIIRNYEGRIVSILTSYERVPQGYRNVYLRVFSVDRERLDQLKAELQDKAPMLYMVDHREERREIYSEYASFLHSSLKSPI